MQLQTWKIQGRGAFHFGEHGIGQEAGRLTWPSDSLFAALIARLASLHGPEAVTAWLGTPEKPHTPPFLLTSTFPYAGKVRFFPVPKAALRGDPPQGLRHKDLKKVRFVSERIYYQLLKGKRLAEVFSKAMRLHNKTLWVLQEETEHLPPQYDKQGHFIPVEKRHFWAIIKRPRVAVGRSPQNSNLFHVGAVHFAEGCGLWFGVQWLIDTPTQRDLLKTLLKDLGDAGLGAERSAGYGQAEITKDDQITLPNPTGGLWTTLSRYLPAADEIAALTRPEAAYDIQRVGGWIDNSTLRRRALNLLAEGAVLGPVGKTPPYGLAVDARPRPNAQRKDNFTEPNHPVWRVGLAVAVGYGGKA